MLLYTSKSSFLNYKLIWEVFYPHFPSLDTPFDWIDVNSIVPNCFITLQLPIFTTRGHLQASEGKTSHKGQKWGMKIYRPLRDS
jgi:hypothetical protein